MMRKFTHLFLMSAVWFSVGSCNDDEIATPPKPSFQPSASTAEVGQEITFTINQVDADAISLLPYGLPGSDPGILITKFNDGVATVTFKYARPGTFQAIVVANNHSEDGVNVENVQSDPATITIFSSSNSISAFSFKDISTETTIDDDAKTIDVQVLYGTDVTKLKADFTASPFSTVTVGGVEQISGTTENNFSTPKVYKVTADNGVSSDYMVTVNVTPIETTNTIASISAIAVSESADEKELGVSVNNTTRTIVIYDTLNTPITQFDSVRIAYELDGEFALLKYGGKVMDQDTLLNLTSLKEFDVYSQDSTSAGGIQTYSVYVVDAPKLALSFPGLIPDPADGVKPTNFSINISALRGTDKSSINTLTSTTSPAGVTVTGTKVDGVNFVSGSAVDYSEPVEFALTVADSNLGISYTVTYTVTVTVVP
jgi:hypothetical protein